MKHTRLLSLIPAFAGFFPAAAAAVEIDFQNYNPYAVTVQNQPPEGTNHWVGANDWLKVGINEVSGNKFLAWPEKNPAKLSSQRIALVDEQGKPFPAKGRYAFSFELRTADKPPADGFDTQQRIIIGAQGPAGSGGSVVSITVYSNGRVSFSNAKELVGAKSYDGRAIDLDDQEKFITISGGIDYDKQTFTLDVDGVPQVTPGKPPFAFMVEKTAFADAGKLDITSPNIAEGRVVNYRRLELDNFKFEPVK